MESSALTNIRIGGVPEHFNLPWHLAMEEDQFKKKGVFVDWTTYRGGTGQMIKALEKEEVDICVLLTEGVVKAMVNGVKCKIISQYIDSPLIWGVHTGADNDIQHYDEVFGRRFAISRFGSGSHLMPQVDAKNKGKVIRDDQYELIRNLEGALSSLSAFQSDVFYWEKFTTKPYVDSGKLRRLGEFITPWPCFVLAATDKAILEKPEAIQSVLRVIQFTSAQFMRSPIAIDMVSERYEQKKEDVARWFYSTEWSHDSWVSDRVLENVVFTLKDTGILSPEADIPELIWKR
jgi:ABC-type nitrate/sulfonate/bicarbonate transport system substrate-binding protein